VGEAGLTNSPQALEIRMFYQFEDQSIRHRYKTIDWVIEDFMVCGHGFVFRVCLNIGGLVRKRGKFQLIEAGKAELCSA
jgi:hypothetical protein